MSGETVHAPKKCAFLECPWLAEPGAEHCDFHHKCLTRYFQSERDLRKGRSS